jgi:hypothetical protein
VQHYQKNVTGVLLWCSPCGKKTMHRVDENRVGNCVEPHALGLSRAQQKREAVKDKEANTQTMDLFE